jgi:hypothetical protein
MAFGSTWHTSLGNVGEISSDATQVVMPIHELRLLQINQHCALN